MYSSTSFLSSERNLLAWQQKAWGSSLCSNMPSAPIRERSLLLIRASLPVKAMLLAATQTRMELRSSRMREPVTLPLSIQINIPTKHLQHYGIIYMQQPQTHKSPFACRIRTADLTLLHAIPTSYGELKTAALVAGCLRRNQLGLYRGNQAYYDDLQIVLDHDRENAPHLLRSSKINVNKDGTLVLPQCIDCGKYNPSFKFCKQCEHTHYCSDGCEVRAKLTHLDHCRSKILPNIDSPLQVEVHLGSDLGSNVEVYFQHEMRMSLQLRGERAMKAMFDYFNGEGQPHIPQNFTVDIFNKHLRYRKLDESKFLSTGSGYCADSLDKIVKLYKSNGFLSQIQVFLYRRGAVLWKEIKEIHNNHFHLIYVFLSCD